MWTLLNPLLNTIVLTIAFSSLFRFDIPNYPVYLLIGLLIWNFFAQTTTISIHTLVWGSNLLRRIYVPRTVFTVSVVGNGLVNLFLGLIPLFIIMAFMRHPVDRSILFLPIAIFINTVFTLGVSLIISLAAIFYADVVDIYNVMVNALFYLTPIIYPIEIFPENLTWVLRINPLYYMVELFRRPLFENLLPTGETTLIASLWAVGTLLFGWWLFTKKSDDFAYQV